MSCTKCSLHKTAQSVCLLGQGPKPAEIMFIGEAPGYREDDVNKPFQGAAGKFLDEIFQELGIDRKSVYITNTVRCRPPDNRKPQAREIKACHEWLEYELKQVKPKYIVLLGATAIKNFEDLKKGKITKVRGRFFKIENYQVFPTFHPAAVFYDDAKKEILKADMRNFWKSINGEDVTKKDGFHPIIVDSRKRLEECYADLRENKIIAYDLETEGLDPFGPEQVTMIGLGTRKNQWVIPLKHKEAHFAKRINQPKLFRNIAKIINARKVIAQNGKFDSLWTKVKYGVDIEITHDTMIMSYLLDENTPNGLKYLATTHFGAPDYDLTVEQKKGGAPLKLLAEYNALDVYYTRKLYFKLYKELSLDTRLLNFYKQVMMPAVGVFRDIEYHGIYSNPVQLDDVYRKMTKKLKAVHRKLKKYGDINWNSTKQISELLFSKKKDGGLGITPLELTDKEQPSTAESVMKRLAQKYEVASLILKYREYSKGAGTFLSGWKEKGVDNRLHPTFNLIKVWDREESKGTVTGRLSCVNPNLQQVPRDPTLRSIMQAPEGWTFVEADLSQIELRIVAMLSGDKEMKRAFQAGEDIHTVTAIAVSGQDMSDTKGFDAKEWRKKAKPINFGFVYGMGVDTFLEYARDKYGVEFTYDEGEEVRDRYFTKYSGLRPWHKKQIRLAKLNGYVRCLSGRVRHLPNIYSENRASRGYAERQAINSPVQGMASDINLMAAIEIHQTLKGKVHLVGTVHDSILMEVKNEYLKEVVKKVHEIMRHPKLFDVLDINPTVPIMADVSVGPWGSGIKEEL